jgi:hypothetical protein
MEGAITDPMAMFVTPLVFGAIVWLLNGGHW